MPFNAYPLTSHRAHDYDYLIRRWKKAARHLKASLSQVGVVDDLPVFEFRRPIADARTLYISAGIHGDEPAGTEALIHLLENSPELLDGWDLTLFPCLNPWGLLNNSRHSRESLDWNRGWSMESHALARIIASRIDGAHFDLALTLHEDFDAQGFYLYEVPGKRPHRGAEIVEAVRPVMPLDPRRKIDGHPCRCGIIRRRITSAVRELSPEAIVLSAQHADRVFTFETPSEFALCDRVLAQQTALQAALRLLKL